MICEECKGDTTSSSAAAIAYDKYGPFNHKVIYGINCYKCKTKDTASLIVRVARQLEIDTGTALICVRRRPWCYSKHFRSEPRSISGHVDLNILSLMNPGPKKWEKIKLLQGSNNLLLESERLMIGNKWFTPAPYEPDLKLDYNGFRKTLFKGLDLYKLFKENGINGTLIEFLYKIARVWTIHIYDILF